MADKALGGLRGPPPQLLPLHSPSLCSILTGPTFIPALPLAWNHLSVAVPTLCFPTSCKSLLNVSVSQRPFLTTLLGAAHSISYCLYPALFFLLVSSPPPSTHTHTHNWCFAIGLPDYNAFSLKAGILVVLFSAGPLIPNPPPGPYTRTQYRWRDIHLVVRLSPSGRCLGRGLLPLRSEC